MHIDDVDWGSDEERVAHVAAHDVIADEVEQVLFGRHAQRSGRDGTMLVYGRTDAGRFLLVVVAPRPRRSVFVVTARDMDQAERRRFRQWEER